MILLSVFRPCCSQMIVLNDFHIMPLIVLNREWRGRVIGSNYILLVMGRGNFCVARCCNSFDAQAAFCSPHLIMHEMKMNVLSLCIITCLSFQEHVWDASHYLVRLVFNGLKEMFTGTREIQVASAYLRQFELMPILLFFHRFEIYFMI